jgi:hypothetical protein
LGSEAAVARRTPSRRLMLMPTVPETASNVLAPERKSVPGPALVIGAVLATSAEIVSVAEGSATV